VFYETGPRLLKTLAAVEQALPGREIAVAREITKLHEECRSGTAEELREHYSAHPPKGEIVLLVAPAPAGGAASAEDADALLAEALQTLKPSQAAAHVAKATGIERKELYARALALRS
jgi:16S rRNA (cytidine1402-2'-O)-methyltransferase